MSSSSYNNEIDINFTFERYWSVLKRRWLPAVTVFGGCIALSAFAAATIEPSYRASSKILVESDKTSALTDVGQTGLDGIGDLRALGRLSDPIVTAVESIRTVPVANDTIDALGLEDSETGESLTPVGFLGNLGVEPIPGTDMIRLSYEAKTAEEAAVVVNTLMDVYIQRNIQENYDKASEAREFLAQQLPVREAAVQEAEVALRFFQEQNSVVSLENEANEVIQILSRLDETIAAAQSQLATTEAQSLELQRQLGMEPGEALNVTALSQSQPIQNTYAQLQEIEGQLDLERARYRDSHPTILELQRQRDGLTQRLQERIGDVVGNASAIEVSDLQAGALQQQLTGDLVQVEVARIGLAQQIEELNREREYQQDRASLFPSLGQSQRELERNLRTAQTAYDLLVQRLQEIDIATGQPVANVSVVSAALQPEHPVTSSKKLILAGGFLAGILTALATAFLIDLFDRNAISPRTIQAFFRFPLLGNIPFFSRLSKHNATQLLISGEQPQSQQANRAYWTLRTHLQQALSVEKSRAIVVSSSFEKEGKSTVIANLGLAMAQSGQKVLIVDADLQSPSQHQLWHCSNKEGLYKLMDNKLESNNSVQNVASNIWLLTAGEVELEGEMLMLEDFKTVLDSFRKAYDVVLIDTPALASSLDALSIAQVADGIALVVRPGNISSMDELNMTRDLVTQAAIPMLGLIVNGSKDESSSFSATGVATAENGWFYPYSPKIAGASEGNEIGSAKNHAIATGKGSVSSNGRL